MAKRQAGASKRYARALIEIALEEKNIEKMNQELKGFSELLEGSQDLKNVLFRKICSAAEKKQVVQDLLQEMKLIKTIQNFLFFLVDQNKFDLFFEIEKQFHQKCDEISQVTEIQVFSAAPFAKGSQKKMNEQLEKWVGKKTRVIYKVDENLIGGVITKIGNHVYDGSVKTQLRSLEQQLLSHSRESGNL